MCFVKLFPDTLCFVLSRQGRERDGGARGKKPVKPLAFLFHTEKIIDVRGCQKQHLQLTAGRKGCVGVEWFAMLGEYLTVRTATNSKVNGSNNNNNHRSHMGTAQKLS